MNSLSVGFFYLCGMAWALVECCILSSQGNSMPLIIWSLAFCVIFGILGCLDLPDRTLNKTGTILAGVLGVVLLGFSFMSWRASGTMVGLPKLLAAGVFVLGSLGALTPDSAAEDQGATADH